MRIKPSRSIVFRSHGSYMCAEYRRIVDAALSTKQFVPADFLQQQKKSVADESDVLEILHIYADQVTGKDERRKASGKRAAALESLLSPRGRAKLCECKMDIRMGVEKIQKERDRRIDPPQQCQQYAVPTEPWELIEFMQKWGENQQDDARYYLHMVFRYQMRLLHKACVQKGKVLAHPSLQCIVDHLHPSPCSSTFPPEFKRFMDDCAARTVKVVSLPVPKKGSGKDVDYTANFEAIPAVTALRIKLQKTIPLWNCEDVYPEYLRSGGRGNDEISKAMISCARAREAKDRWQHIDPNTSEVVKKVMAAVPQLSGLACQYALYECTTEGERLKERLGFFLRPSVRNVFLVVKSKGFVGDVFEASGASYDQFRNLDLFCTAESQLEFLDREDGENDSRALLLLLESVVTLFGSCPDEFFLEPSEVVRDAIASIEASYKF